MLRLDGQLSTEVQSRPIWDGASISPADAQFPLVHLDWHEGHGFVLHCYEDEESWSYFLVTGLHFSTPSIEVELGGQALERWPRELFVSAERAAQAMNPFLDFGKQDPALEWVRIDGFPREVVREGREQREAWERANRARQGASELAHCAALTLQWSRGPLMTVKAVYENGVFKPREPIHLKEHTEVEVVIPAATPSDADDPTGWKAAEALIGFIDDAPADMAERHDQYLYGAPKA